MAGPCQAGDVLGLVDGEVVIVGGDLAQVAGELLERMLAGGGELVTLVLGGGRRPAPGRAAGARTWPGDHPGVEVSVHRGGAAGRPAADRGRVSGRRCETPLRDVVGGKTAKALDDGARTCSTVGDLLRHYPRRYAERGELTDLRDLSSASDVTVWPRSARSTARPMRARPGADRSRSTSPTAAARSS